MPNQVLPEISIIVPVYNPPEKYLRECLDSLIGQSLKNIEIILIDNASIGGCPQILQEYAARDKRIKLFRFEENQGVSAAINQGIKAATADYFQIVDSDDILKKNAGKKLMQAVRKYKQPDIVIFDGDSIFPDYRGYVPKSRLRKDHESIQNLFGQIITGSKERSIILQYTTAQYWNKLYRRQMIIDNGNFLCEKLFAAFPDVLFSFKSVCYAARLVIIPDSLYVYKESIGLSSKFSYPDCPYFDAPLILADEFIKFLTQNQLPEELRKVIVSQGIIFHIKQFFAEYPCSRQREYIKKLKKIMQQIPLPVLENNPKLTKFYNQTATKNFYYIKKMLLTTSQKKFLGGLIRKKNIAGFACYYFLGIRFFKLREKHRKNKPPTN